MNKHLQNLNRLEFVVTMACSGRCKHCSQGEHKSTENIDKKIAADTVRLVAEEYNINSVMTFGGEPLLYPKTVCEIHNAAKQMNIPRRQLITNGYFSKDYDRIKQVANMITESGVNEILLSVDAFHQETIPLEPVKAFAECVLESDAVIKVHPAWLVSKDDINPYNSKTKEILRNFNRMGINTGEGNVIFPAGNAVKYLSEYLDLSKKTRNPYEENPSDIKAVCIGADGGVLGGNINFCSITEIFSSYTPK